MSRRRLTVLPAQAGVDRRWRAACGITARAPRAGGGGPARSPGTDHQRRCSPRRRGWTDGAELPAWWAAVLPAQAGVDRQMPGPAAMIHSAPRAGGGGPPTPPPSSAPMACSPRRRGWTVPDRAGPLLLECSPRRRGWTGHGADHLSHDHVLPAQAGVDRRRRACPGGSRCAPRAGGGGPASTPPQRPQAACSPRRRGWTGRRLCHHQAGPVLPAQAGVDRTSLRRRAIGSRAPRAGGGGPPQRRPRPRPATCSPRRRGWTETRLQRSLTLQVLPAQAGVDRGERPGRRLPFRAPRAGGGGPRTRTSTGARLRCSPRRRGWTARALGQQVRRLVLPAQAGVDR